jgi:hypothetical protein
MSSAPRSKPIRVTPNPRTEGVRPTSHLIIDLLSAGPESSGQSRSGRPRVGSRPINVFRAAIDFFNSFRRRAIVSKDRIYTFATGRYRSMKHPNNGATPLLRSQRQEMATGFVTTLEVSSRIAGVSNHFFSVRSRAYHLSPTVTSKLLP